MYCDNIFEPLTPYRFEKDRDEILAILADGCKYTNDEFNEQDVADWFDSGVVKIWLGYIEKGSSKIINITVTNVIQKKQKELNVLLWCGTAWDWELVWRCINEVAKIEQCQNITMRGRRGFLRRFAKFGAKEKYSIIKMGVV
jgi:hypothetical protein